MRKSYAHSPAPTIQSIFLQANAVWSPDEKYLVFEHAIAKDPYPADGKMAAFANDPEEVKIQYDLYRIDFNGGKGGTPVPIEGASNNGMSNSFPKVSPDGKWIVYVQAQNGHAHASRQQALDCSGNRRNPAPDALQHIADELLAQLLAQRALARVFVKKPKPLYADVPHAHRRGWHRLACHPD